jgi:hypothetical protein
MINDDYYILISNIISNNYINSKVKELVFYNNFEIIKYIIKHNLYSYFREIIKLKCIKEYLLLNNVNTSNIYYIYYHFKTL